MNEYHFFVEICFKEKGKVFSIGPKWITAKNLEDLAMKIQKEYPDLIKFKVEEFWYITQEVPR